MRRQQWHCRWTYRLRTRAQHDVFTFNVSRKGTARSLRAYIAVSPQIHCNPSSFVFVFFFLGYLAVWPQVTNKRIVIVIVNKRNLGLVHPMQCVHTGFCSMWNDYTGWCQGD